MLGGYAGGDGELRLLQPHEWLQLFPPPLATQAWHAPPLHMPGSAQASPPPLLMHMQQESPREVCTTPKEVITKKAAFAMVGTQYSKGKVA